MANQKAYEELKAAKEKAQALGEEIMETLSRFYGNAVLVSAKFSLGVINSQLKDFDQSHQHQTGNCKKFTKGNLQEIWSTWKV